MDIKVNQWVEVELEENRLEIKYNGDLPTFTNDKKTLKVKVFEIERDGCILVEVPDPKLNGWSYRERRCWRLRQNYYRLTTKPKCRKCKDMV